jgi:hypothetical protein
MRRLVEMAVGSALVAISLAGCVVDPYYDDRYRAGHDRPYDQYGYHPPKRPPRDEWDRGDRDDYKLPTIVCASKDGRANRCRTDFPIKRAVLDKRYSGSPCEYGRSWGYDGNEIWVDRGCRARFVVTPAGRWR